MSSEEVREALADLEALIAADPSNADPEVLAAAAELRGALGEERDGDADGEEQRGGGGEGKGKEDEDGAGAGKDVVPPPDLKRKREEGENDANDDTTGVNRAPNNERMHPRNVYKEKNPDFGTLAERQPFLKPFLKRRGSKKENRFGIDFTRWDATKALNRALLMDHYGLVAWDIPEGQLCPPVTNRANYVHWLEDLLRLSRPAGVGETGARVRGIDVGVGANCVYPLLGASINGWSFVGSDVTDVALRCAAENAAANPAVASLIEIRDVRRSSRGGGGSGGSGGGGEDGGNGGDGGGDGGGGSGDGGSGGGGDGGEGIQGGGGGGDKGDDDNDHDNDDYTNGPGDGLLLPVVREGERFAFCMCNPPFFESMDEAELNPSTNFGGTPDEMCCEGGEEAFVQRIYNDSLVLRDRVYWYTTMCGKKDTMKRLRRLLELRRVPAVRTTQFLQGKTTRWGVAWSFAKEAGGTGATPLQPGGGGGGGGGGPVGGGVRSGGGGGGGGGGAGFVPPSVKPCYRMTFEMQVGRSSGRGASEVLRELKLALESAGCVTEPPDARDPLTLRCRAGGGGVHFSATVMQPAPGSLMIQAACDAGPKTDGHAQKLFAQAMVMARTRMLA